MAQAHVPILSNIRDFLRVLERRGQLARIAEPVSTMLEVRELHRRTIEKHGPVLHVEGPIKADGTASAIPLVENLF
jgi:4-hydroxy-3-polyprenylbenzoate decarboxylase